jgi:hypothetical protein
VNRNDVTINAIHSKQKISVTNYWVAGLFKFGCIPRVPPSLLLDSFNSRSLRWELDKEREKQYSVTDLRECLFDEINTHKNIDHKLRHRREQYQRNRPSSVTRGTSRGTICSTCPARIRRYLSCNVCSELSLSECLLLHSRSHSFIIYNSFSRPLLVLFCLFFYYRRGKVDVDMILTRARTSR